MADSPTMFSDGATPIPADPPPGSELFGGPPDNEVPMAFVPGPGGAPVLVVYDPSARVPTESERSRAFTPEGPWRLSEEEFDALRKASAAGA